eukprot:4332118-Pyramimonas_sp.AAC.1
MLPQGNSIAIPTRSNAAGLREATLEPALESQWNCSVVALESRWNRVGIALESRWNRVGIASPAGNRRYHAAFVASIRQAAAAQEGEVPD